MTDPRAEVEALRKTMQDILDNGSIYHDVGSIHERLRLALHASAARPALPPADKDDWWQDTEPRPALPSAGLREALQRGTDGHVHDYRPLCTYCRATAVEVFDHAFSALHPADPSAE